MRAFLILVVVTVNAAIAGYLLVEVPSPNRAATLQTNLYFYADGSPLAQEGQVNRESVPLARVPLHVRRAVLAAEDRDFYSSGSVDVRGMARGAWRTVTGKGVQSGSTITQQFVKNYYLDQEQTFARKAKELVIAMKLGRTESKDAILQGYLNTSFFGRNAYGIEAAAQAYYGKSADRLTVAEGAYLAALLNAPSMYDVVTHPEHEGRALARWRYVLDGMVQQGWLDPAERAATVFPAPRPPRPPADLAGQRGYLVEAVREHLITTGIVDEARLAAGGWRIVTTIRRDRQEELVRAVDTEIVSALDYRRPQDRFVRVGCVSMDPATGEVVALYGGYDFTRQYVSNATRHDFQVGSVFKPFVLAAALSPGALTTGGEPIGPDTIYDGTSGRPVVASGGLVGYAPGNEDGIDYGPVSVRTATAKSVNSVYAQMAADVGLTQVVSTAVALGLPAGTPGLVPAPAIALGAAQPSVLELTGAYATLAHHGVRVEPTLVRSIDHDGAAIGLPARDGAQVIPRAAADTVTEVLVGAVENGTGREAKSTVRPVAGKTGTAEDDRAAWFAGYTPELATVVAVLGQDPVSGTQQSLHGALGQARVDGGGYPARVWAAYTAAVLRGKEPEGFVLQLR
ncbi:transglycosylase domain-containing protein [Streptomyces microflavus]|uniref:transglycosylase domain-containing protein n=1 Tax=Streptomyces microflavus TaxID=1919 RepID=UPI00366624A6